MRGCQLVDLGETVAVESPLRASLSSEKIWWITSAGRSGAGEVRFACVLFVSCCFFVGRAMAIRSSTNREKVNEELGRRKR